MKVVPPLLMVTWLVKSRILDVKSGYFDLLKAGVSSTT
jgi:hypothetical protein